MKAFGCEDFDDAMVRMEWSIALDTDARLPAYAGNGFV